MATTQVTGQILDLLEALRGCVQECVAGSVAGTAENYVGHRPSGQVCIETSTGHSAAVIASGKENVSGLSAVTAVRSLESHTGSLNAFR